ncbi:hypothetical protein SISSUDRAFT_721866 [Sistotremastrum suecicum HHB10207 ss-3]|uniref:Uncharacterized protein n=1 Tax=Sistotremastrum suecicum HHB10207 ss-3 TaxID=1314776 RepID=A0A166DL79_9AGAM|nr:hypothetical protein SISSUDRAFT_721866 [Sistotremastrum suecicum HHB10207 ss-3]
MNLTQATLISSPAGLLTTTCLNASRYSLFSSESSRNSTTPCNQVLYNTCLPLESNGRLYILYFGIAAAIFFREHGMKGPRRASLYILLWTWKILTSLPRTLISLCGLSLHVLVHIMAVGIEYYGAYMHANVSLSASLYQF